MSDFLPASCLPQVPGETLFPIEEAIKRGTVIMNLLSDAAQSKTWNDIKPLITKDKTLYFSHGFSVVYKEDVSCTSSSFVCVRVDLATDTGFPPVRPVSSPLRTSMSSSSPPRDRAAPSALSSRRVVESTPRSPSSRVRLWWCLFDIAQSLTCFPSLRRHRQGSGEGRCHRYRCRIRLHVRDHL